jgi:GAF domain-containing protein
LYGLAGSDLCWAAPLSTGENPFGVLRIDLKKPQSDAGEQLSAIALPLSLAIDYLQAIPLTRALTFTQQLATVRTVQDMAGIIAEYVGSESSLIDLTLYEYDENEPVRARSIVLSQNGTTELTDFSVDMSDYLLRAAIPSLKTGEMIHIEDIYTSPLIPVDKQGYFRAQKVSRITLLPLKVDENLLGVLSIAGQRLSPNDYCGLQTLVNQIAVLIQNRSLFERTANALDEVQQLYRFGSAILHATDATTLIKAVFEQFSTPPDALSLDAVHLDISGNPLAFITEAVISSTQGIGESGGMLDIASHQLENYAHLLEQGQPLLINNIKTDSTLSSVARAYFTGRKIQALSVFPILMDGKLSHTVTAAYSNPHIYTSDEIRLLNRLTEQIGLEVRNWDLLRQTQDQTNRLSRQVRLLESLYETSRQVSANLAIPDVLQVSCRNLAETLVVDYVAILRFDQGIVMAEHPALMGSDTRLVLEGFGVYKHLQTYRTPLILRPADPDDAMLGPNLPHFAKLHVQSILLAPLLAQGDLLGALALGVENGSRIFSQEELHVSQAIATQIAISLRNAELFAEIRRRASQLERVAAFGRLITSTFEPQEIMQGVSDVLPNLLQLDFMSLVLYTVGQRDMQVIDLGETINETSLPAGSTSTEEVVRTQAPLLVPDLTSSNYIDHQIWARQGLSSALIAPLVVGARALGTVSVAHNRPRAYSLTDLTLLQQVGNQIAIALENARLFQSTRARAAYEESLSEITSRLQQQTDLRELLHQTMQDLGQTIGARRARVRLQIQPGNGSHPLEE